MYLWESQLQKNKLVTTNLLREKSSDPVKVHVHVSEMGGHP